MRCGAAAIPDGASNAGRFIDPAAVARALKSLLARNEVVQTRALVAASDAIATFRVLTVAPGSTSKEIDATIAHELPFDPQQTASKWLEVEASPESRVVYAAAWDRALVKGVSDAVRLAGIEPAVVELKSASVARAVPAASCVLVDLSSRPAELILIDRHLPRVWHSFDVPESLGDDAAALLAPPLRSMLRFYRRRSEGSFGQAQPIYISAEQTLAPTVLTELSALVDQPVMVLPAPARIPPDVRHSTYLACLGLLMRRSG
jgi:hypothetical protein